MRGMAPRERERGVSDLVAFVLTFSVIIFGVGVVSTGAFDTLVDFTDGQHVQNSERGLESAASTLDNLDENSDTYREFDISIAGGQLFFTQTSINVTVENSSAPPPSYDEQIQLNAFEKTFENRDLTLAFEGGGVFRDPSARPRYEPSVQCGSPGGGQIGDEIAVVSLLTMTTNFATGTDSTRDRINVGPTDVVEEVPLSAGNEYASFRAQVVDQSTYTESGDLNVTLDTSGTAYPDQWDNHLTKAGWEDTGGNTYACDIQGTAVIRTTTADLDEFNSD